VGHTARTHGEPRATSVAPNSFDVTSVATGGVPRRIAFGLNGAAAVVSNEWGWVDVVR
jgi:hypothetical protein